MKNGRKDLDCVPAIIFAFAVALVIWFVFFRNDSSRSSHSGQLARRAATALETSALNFYTEYGRLPKHGVVDATVRTDEDIPFLNAVLGLETSSDPLNPRSVKFLSVREGEKNKNGLIYAEGSGSVIGLFDPWGGPYFVILDLDYDGEVTVPVGGGITLHRRVTVWSNGPDGKPGTGDDVRTW